MSFRRFIFWSHLAVGLATGLVIFVLALTGVALTYETQIRGWFGPSVGPTVEYAEMLPADDIMTIAAPVFSGQMATLDFYRDATEPVAVKAGRHEAQLIDPYSGALLTPEDAPVDGFFTVMEDLHKHLAAGYGSVGQDIVKAGNLAFLFILISGLYLWLPRRWKWPFLKQRMVFTKMPTAKARDFNWHHVLAFWTIIPLLAIVGSGAVLSYQWASELVFNAAGLEAPQGRGSGKGMWARNSGGGASNLPASQLVSYQTLLEDARQVEDGWRTISFVIPTSDTARTVDVVIDTGNGKQINAQQTVTYSRETGEIVSRKGPEEMANPTQTLRRYIRFLHSGEIYGIVGQTIAGLASLATLVLVWTGFALAWRRLISPLFRPHAKASPSSH